MWWLAPSPHSRRVPGSVPSWGLSVWSLHVLLVYTWVLFGYSGFLPPSRSMHVESIGNLSRVYPAFSKKLGQRQQKAGKVSGTKKKQLEEHCGIN